MRRDLFNGIDHVGERAFGLGIGSVDKTLEGFSVPSLKLFISRGVSDGSSLEQVIAEVMMAIFRDVDLRAIWGIRFATLWSGEYHKVVSAKVYMRSLPCGLTFIFAFLYALAPKVFLVSGGDGGPRPSLNFQGSKYAKVAKETSLASDQMTKVTELLHKVAEEVNTTIAQAAWEDQQYKRKVIDKDVHLWQFNVKVEALEREVAKFQRFDARVEALENEVIDYRQKLVEAQQLAEVLEKICDDDIKATRATNMQVMIANDEVKEDRVKAQRQKEIVAMSATKTLKIKMELDDKIEALATSEAKIHKLWTANERTKEVFAHADSHFPKFEGFIDMCERNIVYDVQRMLSPVDMRG
ncbi:hypothetical protein V6N11_013061 [Hibiscus sabdariffa]